MEKEISIDATEVLFAEHKKLNISAQLTVAMLCRINGIRFSALAESAGYHRNSLYLSLTGQTPPSPELISHVTYIIGVSPWEYGPLIPTRSEKPVDPDFSKRLFQLHSDFFIPLQHTVAVMGKVMGFKSKDLADEIGCTHSIFYNYLSGTTTPNREVRDLFIKKFNCDPWVGTAFAA